MATLVATLPALSTLDKALQIQNFHKSRTLYNGLLDDCDQPAVADEHIANLADLFVRHNADKVLGIHLIHGHFKIPESTVMVGTNFENPAIRWTKVTKIDDIDPATVHGHIFVLFENGLCAYEFQDGPLPDLSGIRQGFLAEFVDYIVKHNLTSVIGLQVLGCGDNSMSELILDQGTVMLNTSVVKNTTPTRVTGWKFESVDGNPHVCKSNETHSRLANGTHGVFNSGKPLPKLENIEDLKVALVEAGIL